MIKDFCGKMDKVYIVEEDDPYIEEFCKTLGLEVHGKDTFPSYGEMTPDVLRKSLTGETLPEVQYDHDKVIKRPPTLCAGCPHRGLFYRLGRGRTS